MRGGLNFDFVVASGPARPMDGGRGVLRVLHHDGGWNHGSAVLIAGHEGDTLYDTCPLPPPGSLTIRWRHP